MTVRVRLSRFWYDGPQIAAEVLCGSKWEPYGATDVAEEVHAALAPEFDPHEWPVGEYDLIDGRLVKADA